MIIANKILPKPINNLVNQLTGFIIGLDICSIFFAPSFLA